MTSSNKSVPCLEDGNVVRPIGWFGKPEPMPPGHLQDDPSILAFMLETVSAHHASRWELEQCHQTLASDGRLSHAQSHWLRGWYQNRMRVITAKDRDRQAKADARAKLAAERAAFKAEMKAERAALKKEKAEIAAERAALRLELAALERAKGKKL